MGQYRSQRSAVAQMQVPVVRPDNSEMHGKIPQGNTAILVDFQRAVSHACCANRRIGAESTQKRFHNSVIFP
jgi:hypothetical protein